MYLFVLDTDASNQGIREVLSQEHDDGLEHVVAGICQLGVEQRQTEIQYAEKSAIYAHVIFQKILI